MWSLACGGTAEPNADAADWLKDSVVTTSQAREARPGWYRPGRTVWAVDLRAGSRTSFSELRALVQQAQQREPQLVCGLPTVSQYVTQEAWKTAVVSPVASGDGKGVSDVYGRLCTTSARFINGRCQASSHVLCTFQAI